MAGVFQVLELDAAAAAGLRPALIALLQDAVAAGASVGFLPPLDVATASGYWSDVERDLTAGTRVLLAALDGANLLGAVQLELAQMANARHRAEVQKLLVFREARRHGVGAALMAEAEDAARARSRTLLVLDTRAGDDAERLYRRLGWSEAGRIPAYALSAAGRLEATVFFFKQLEL
jgi:GNAT superfamily N-acetyltransferase